MCIMCVNEKARDDLDPKTKKANRRARHERLRSPSNPNSWLQGVQNGLAELKNRPKVVRN